MRDLKMAAVALFGAVTTACVSDSAPSAGTRLGYWHGYDLDAAMSIIENPYADPMLRQSAMEILGMSHGIAPPRPVLRCNTYENETTCYGQ